MLENATRSALDGELSMPHAISEERLRILARVKRAVRRKTGGGVAKLAVQFEGHAVVLSGVCTSFYCKQLAQETAKSLLKDCDETLLNQIEVSPAPH